MFVRNLHVTFHVMYTPVNFLSASSLTVHPRTGPEGPNVEQTYSSTLYLTSALDGGRRSTPPSGRLTASNNPVPILQEAGWAPEPVWKGEKNRPHRDEIPGTSSPAHMLNLIRLISEETEVLLHYIIRAFRTGLCSLLLFAAPQLDKSLHQVAVLLGFSCKFIFPKRIKYFSLQFFYFLQGSMNPMLQLHIPF